MHTRRMVVTVLALCALFVSVWMLPDAVASEGAREPARPLAEMTLSASRIDWLPAGDSEHLVLTVAGPAGLWIRREFESGQPAFLSLAGPEWERLPDGTYIWELRATPPPGNLPEKPLVESGHFFVKNGSFVPARKKASVAPPRPPRLLTAEDIVEYGNLVVVGNACIGASCTPDDDDYSALRLKAPQPNIRFDDDFVEGGSDPHDWGLFINPNSAAEFSIADVENGLFPFTIAGGAPNSSVYVGSNGNVGLGTATPALRLDVKANAAGNAVARFQNSSATGFSGIEFLNNAGTAAAFLGTDNANANTRFNSFNNYPIVILTNNVERMRVTTDGKLGIGTASPSDKFHFFENTNASTLFTVENSNTGPLAASALRAKSDSALAGLVAHGSAKTISRFGQTLGGWAELAQATGNGLIIGTQADKPLILGTNNVNRIHITAAGDVGIGTTAPLSLLHVNGGDIRVSGGSFIDDGVTLNAPDYVFEPSYSLMPLAELREFVAREKHLPNVPAAADIKKEGLNLGRFQMRLLEKIEELALYTLKQEEQIREQQEHVQSLRDENCELKARLEALEKALQPKP